MKPDWWWHARKVIRAFIADITQRVKRVDIQAQAAGWEVVGVDLSYWQQDVDFYKLSTMVDFAFIRAGYGNDFIDPRADEYEAGCLAFNIPFGLYWYVKPGKDISKHALSFYQQYAESFSALPPVFDDEETGGLSKSALESWLRKLYDRFNGLIGKTYPDDLSYTSAGFLNKALPLTDWLKQTNLWVAHWTTAPQPVLPNEWAISGHTWKFWQWSATGKGSDYGVSSKYVDLNRYNGTKAQFIAEFGLPAPPPAPVPRRVKVDKVSKYLNVRLTPAGEDVGELYKNTVVPVVDEQGDWLLITGWINKNYVTEV